MNSLFKSLEQTAPGSADISPKAEIKEQNEVKDVPASLSTDATEKDISKADIGKEIKDDSGDVIGKDGTLAPNKTFILNGINYKTDDSGRVFYVAGKLISSASNQLDKTDYKTDDKGDVKVPPSLNEEAKDSGAETDDKKDVEDTIESLTEEYIKDLKKNSICPDTIPDEPFKPADLKKTPPEKTQELRKQFKDKRDELIDEWEKNNGRKWPVYEEDVYNEYGELIKAKGWKYDAHHIQPLSLGGKNVASNITPLRYDIHSDHKGVHASGSPYDRLEKLLKEGKTNE